MSKWIDFVKEFASKKGMSYRNALKDPECKKDYHASKGGSLGKEPVLSPLPVGRKERKTKKPITKVEEQPKVEEPESPKEKENIKMEILEGGPKPKKERKRPKKTEIIPMEGEGILNAGYSTEAVNGLEHIYPISHQLVLQMVKHLI